jgi:small subunit ribosomal protein S15
MALTKETATSLVNKYGATAKDTGSSKVQVALLTERINQLTEHTKTFKKDKGALRGLIKMVGQRRILLKYMQRTDIDMYRSFIKEVGLRK